MADPHTPTPDDIHTELVECLTHLVAYARRQQYIVARFNDDEPTAWDKAHARIDAALDDLEECAP
jgi:hypothetical protein